MAKRQKNQAALELLVRIKGVGTRTAHRLLDTFKTVEKVSQATQKQLLAAGLNARIAEAVLQWSATQDKDRRPPEPIPIPPPAARPTATETAGQPPAALASSTPTAPEKSTTAANLKLPVPFGNARDVHVRITPPPELVDLESLRNGGPVKTRPLSSAGAAKAQPAAASSAKARPGTKRLVRPKPRAQVQGMAQRPKATPGLQGPYELVNGVGWVFADPKNTKLTSRGKLFAFCDITSKVLAYGMLRYGKAHVIEVK